jgi:hypothetical protein
MKRYLIILMAALVAMAPGAVQKANAVDISLSFGAQINSVGDFHAALSPYGSWVSVGQYGQCWRPTQVSGDWRPYSVGSWEWTDAGWFWQTDEPWGWATCHYGSWYMDPTMGWVWIPGTEWAPAWVSWRYNDNYIGWAPIGPNMSAPAPSLYAFVGMNRFGSGFRPNDLIVNNTTIINQTRSVKNFERQTVNVGGRQQTIFANKGPGVAGIERATGRRMTARPVGEVARQTRTPENLRGNQTPSQARRPGQRPGGEATPAPTGREQQRTYPQQPGQAQPQQPNQSEQRRDQRPGQRPNALSPTGREQQPNNYQRPEQTPAQPQQRELTPRTRPGEETPTTPRTQPHSVTPSQPSERPLPPTGREQSVPNRQQPTERPLPPTGREQAQPPSQPNRERPLPPTGREQAQPSSRPSQTAPSAPEREQPPAEQKQRPSQPQKPQQPQKQDQKRDGSGT